MGKKTFAAIALAVLAVFAVPAAANAAGYVPEANVTVSGAVVAGQSTDVNIADGSFTGGESVIVSVTGEGSATLSAFKAATVSITKTATSAGAASVTVTLPTNATGTYTVTATGVTSQNVATASLTVTAADAGAGNLAATGFATPVVLIWAAGGALLLGLALVVVLTLVRRQRATA